MNSGFIGVTGPRITALLMKIDDEVITVAIVVIEHPIIDRETKERTPELKKMLKHFYSKLGFRHSGEHYMVKDARDCHAQRMRAGKAQPG